MPEEALNIVVVYAHADDGEFHVAGSIAKWAAAGHRVHTICATDGSLGSKVAGSSKADVAATRERELGLALELLGAQPPIMLGYPDGFLADHSVALRERLIYHLRRLEADRVITFDPWKRYECHPDHITIGKMASEAAAFSCFPLLHPEHLENGVKARQPSEVWYMGPLEHKPNRVVEIDETLNLKIEATLRHGSQMEMLADWFVKGADPTQLSDADRSKIREGTADFIEKMGRGMAKAFGRKVSVAECFYALRVGPGHFDNYQQMAMELLAGVVEDPVFE